MNTLKMLSYRIFIIALVFSCHVERIYGEINFFCYSYDRMGDLTSLVRNGLWNGSTSASHLTSAEVPALAHGTYFDRHAFSTIAYDGIERRTFQSTPGDVWSSAGKWHSTAYVTNSSCSITLYQASLGSTSLVQSGFYAANTLSGEVSTDEDGHSLTFFTDRKILERRDGNNDTYFVYDDLGRLRYILSPEYQNAGDITNSAIESVTYYDNLNHPVYVIFTNGNTIKYVYAPDGTKLRTIWLTAVDNIIVPVGHDMELSADQILSADSVDYCGASIYYNGIPDKFLFDGGYCSFDGNTPVFHYYTKDHQGNNRAVVSENGTVEQITHYYPFGGIMTDISTNSSFQSYKYNGKEFDRMHGWDKYDYGARIYDPILNVWTSADPLCEKYYHVSPYAYCLDNPVRFIDVDGMRPGDFFRTADEAAIDFGLYYGDNSIRDGIEYGSSIFKVLNDKGEIGYTYTIANRGTCESVAPSETPLRFKTVAKVHTHGKYMKMYRNNEFSGVRNNDDKKITDNNELKKITEINDIGNANTEKRDSYLASPNGALQKYSYQTGKIKLLSKDMPSDSNDPERLNKKQSFFEQNPVVIFDMNNLFLYNQYLTIP